MQRVNVSHLAVAYRVRPNETPQVIRTLGIFTHKRCFGPVLLSVLRLNTLNGGYMTKGKGSGGHITYISVDCPSPATSVAIYFICKFF